MTCTAFHTAASSPSVDYFRFKAYFYPIPLLLHSERSPFICLSGNESKVNRNALTVCLVDHVTYITVYASDKQPPCYAWLSRFFKPCFIPQQEFHLWGCDIFYVIYSIVLSPPAMAAPPPHPLAISFDNPSLCFCNEKQHSSSGMTSSVSTEAGTEDTTLPRDWIAPT